MGINQAQWNRIMGDAIRQVTADAVTREREACAMIVERYAINAGHIALIIAAEIRQRRCRGD
jgi:hypothetical protein